jgi:diguanylate cyclase (GGDEF)-like protein/PAS domain S-box-containing protein
VTGGPLRLPAGFDVLVVDDHEGTRDSLVDILASAGLPARSAATASAALALQAREPAALAVVDYQLPDATGLELARCLKAEDPDFPVIVLTGNASLETAVAAVALVDEYLTKPVAADAFLRAVRAAAERRRLVLENRGLLVRLQDANATLEAAVVQRTRELQADRERLAEAQRIARIGSWEWDLATKVLTSSAELRRLIGREGCVEPETHDQLFANVLAEDMALADREVADAVAHLGPFAFEVRVQPPGHDIRWLAVRGRVAVDADGNAARLIGTSQDVTDRKWAEEQFRNLLESAPDAMVICGGDGRIILTNRQTERLFGWARGDLIGRPVEVLLPERFRAAHEGHRTGYQTAPQARGMGTGIELFARHADGSEFPVEVSLSPVDTQRGTLVCAAIRDITERKQAAAELAHQALHDALTGLPNRALLLDRLDQALAHAGRAGSGVAVLFLDLDRFKLVNDSRGHATGDELLIGVAERLRRVVRPDDTVARFGGDEFVMICRDAGAVGHAMHVADRVAEAFRTPFRLGGDDMFLNVSIGIAVSDGRASAAELLRDADAAMYQAKEHGRGRCEFFDETMRTEAAARLDLQTALHWAIDRHEMRVFYQPLVDIRSGVPVGVEALVRWAHPTQGIVAPEAFVKLAEESGLIVPIDVAVMEEATRQCAGWPLGPGGTSLNVAANLSVHHLRHPGLVGHVRSVLERSGLPPLSLCLELTESVLLEDVDRHIRTLLELRELGVRLAIDDFGTGFSSLTYLKRFPVDVVKIDRSFVAGLGTDISDTAIVRSVVDLAHALSLQVVAEGVERPEQLEVLRGFGCDLAQGYLFSPPRPASELLPWLAARRSVRPPAIRLDPVRAR